MRRILIDVNGKEIALSAPYHDATTGRARNLGGRWEHGAWRFAAQDIELVREMCRDLWGADDTDDGAETVRLRCTKPKMTHQGDLTLCGVQLARAFGRDSGAKLAMDVIVLKGGFSSGGSVKNWYTQVSEGTVFELRNLPRGTAAKIRAWCRQDNEKASFVVEEDSAKQLKQGLIEALLEERERLVARLREVEAELETVKQESFISSNVDSLAKSAQ